MAAAEGERESEMRESVISELKNEGRERERKRELEEVEQKKKNSEGRPSE